MRELQLRRPRFAYVPENHYGTGDLPILIVDRCSGVFDRQFSPPPLDEQRVAGKADSIVLLNGQFHGVSSRFTIVAIDDTEHFRKHPAERLLTRLARHCFRNHIEIRYPALHVGTDDAIANGIERNLRALSLNEQRVVSGSGFQFSRVTVHLTFNTRGPCGIRSVGYRPFSAENTTCREQALQPISFRGRYLRPFAVPVRVTACVPPSS